METEITSELIDTWKDFARVTIETNDLDPMYEVIYKLNQRHDERWMGRFTLYFLMFYDAGGAAKCANDPADFWSYVLGNFASAKRGVERRHFRGANGLNAIHRLRRKSEDPADIIREMWAPTYTELVKKFETVFAGTQFGPYFIWKIYDLQNICLGRPISLSFEEAVKYMPDEPRKLAMSMWPGMGFENVLRMVGNYIEQFEHPVVKVRGCSWAEAETILCMLKGYFMTQTHIVGDDIKDKWDQLYEFPELRKLLPPLVPTTRYVRGEYHA